MGGLRSFLNDHLYYERINIVISCVFCPRGHLNQSEMSMIKLEKCPSDIVLHATCTRSGHYLNRTRSLKKNVPLI